MIGGLAMNKLKTRLAALAVGLLLVVCLAGCGNKTGEPVTISLWHV